MENFLRWPAENEAASLHRALTWFDSDLRLLEKIIGADRRIYYPVVITEQ